ncbi:MAG: tetratricopeptide repeat protein, partial [Melioribacteraceae bacterium]|nr:tetratricopeptide repeat protein [Melioribacteraceae bacterium]
VFYKLGTIYFEKGQYPLVRQKLLILINEYPESEYFGSAYYWVGESYVNENKFLEGEEFLLEAVSASKSNRFVDHTIYALAYLYEKMGKYSNAVTYYDELLAYHRESKLAPDAQLRIGVSYFYLKEYDSAVLELSDPMINKLSNAFQTEANYYLANAFFRLQEYEHAELTFREVLDKNPSRNIVREMNFGIGWINFQQQNYENAFEIFSNLAVEGSDSISAISLYWSAECERYLGRTDEAMKIYEAFQAKYSDDPLGESVKLNVGIIQFNLNNYSEAERNLVAATISDDKLVKGKALTILGEISLEKSNFLEAEFYFSEALKISLLNQDLSNRAILGLGVSQFFQEKYDESIMNLTDLSIRVQRFEKRKVNFYLGETYFAKRNYSSALKHYHRVTEADDKLYQQALYGKSYSAFNLKDFANSAYYFGVYVNKYKNDEHLLDAKLRLADSYYGTKNFDRASKIYGEIFRDYGTSLINDFALYQYAQSLFKAGDSFDAIEKLNQLQKTYPKSNYADESQYLIGWIYFQQSDFTTAINNYNALMKKYPGSSIRPIAYYSIGDSFYNLGEYDSSIVYYLKLIEEYP